MSFLPFRLHPLLLTLIGHVQSIDLVVEDSISPFGLFQLFQYCLHVKVEDMVYFHGHLFEDRAIDADTSEIRLQLLQQQ